MSCTPRAVRPEPIHPMTPRYIILIEASIKGAKELPKTSIKSDEAEIAVLLLRNTKALTNVNASKPIPVKSIMYEINIVLSSTV